MKKINGGGVWLNEKKQRKKKRVGLKMRNSNLAQLVRKEEREESEREKKKIKTEKRTKRKKREKKKEKESYMCFKIQ